MLEFCYQRNEMKERKIFRSPSIRYDSLVFMQNNKKLSNEEKLNENECPVTESHTYIELSLSRKAKSNQDDYVTAN